MTVSIAAGDEVVSTFITRTAEYADEHGRRVIECVPVRGTPPPGFVRFKGRGQLKLQTLDGREFSHAFSIPLPCATTPGEAFDRLVEEFPAAAEEAARKVREELSAPRVLPAGPGMIGRG